MSHCQWPIAYLKRPRYRKAYLSTLEPFEWCNEIKYKFSNLAKSLFEHFLSKPSRKDCAKFHFKESVKLYLALVDY